METPDKARFSFAAIYSAVGRPTAGEFARTVGRTRRTIERWKAADAIPEQSADAVAIAFNYHPANVWPDQW